MGEFVSCAYSAAVDAAAGIIFNEQKLKNNNMKKIAYMMLAAGFFTLASCETTREEKAEDRIEDTADDVEDEAEDAAEDLEDAAERKN